MGDNDSPDKFNLSLLPRVKILVASSAETVVKSAQEQDYPNKYVSVGNESPSVFFNEEIANRRHETDIFFFLDNNNRFANTESVTQIVDKFVREGMLSSLIYTDNYRNDYGDDDVNLVPQYLPPFDRVHCLSGNEAINSAFAVQSRALPAKPFNEKIQYLHFYYLLRKMAAQHRIIHLAEPLYLTKYPVIDPSEDINYLNE